MLCSALLLVFLVAAPDITVEITTEPADVTQGKPAPAHEQARAPTPAPEDGLGDEPAATLQEVPVPVEVPGPEAPGAAPVMGSKSVPEPPPRPPALADDASERNSGDGDRRSSGAYLSVSATGGVSLRGHSNPLNAGLRTAGGKLWRLPKDLRLYAGGGYQLRKRRLGRHRSTVDQFGFALLRVGRGTDRLWGYGLMAIHLGAQVTAGGPEADEPSVSALLGFEGGGGVAVRVVSALFVAGELAFELGTDPFFSVSESQVALLNARLMIGFSL